MRKKLKKFKGQRLKFCGTIDKFSKKYYKHHEKTVLCLINVTLAHNAECITDHVWMNMTEDLKRLKPKVGDKIKFNARVKEYWKGYVNDDNPYQERDFRLDRPTNIIKISDYRIKNLTNY